MVNRCFGKLDFELPVVEALSFLDRTESDRFLQETRTLSVTENDRLNVEEE